MMAANFEIFKCFENDCTIWSIQKWHDSNSIITQKKRASRFKFTFGVFLCKLKIYCRTVIIDYLCCVQKHYCVLHKNYLIPCDTVLVISGASPLSLSTKPEIKYSDYRNLIKRMYLNTSPFDGIHNVLQHDLRKASNQQLHFSYHHPNYRLP